MLNALLALSWAVYHYTALNHTDASDVHLWAMDAHWCTAWSYDCMMLDAQHWAICWYLHGVQHRAILLVPDAHQWAVDVQHWTRIEPWILMHAWCTVLSHIDALMPDSMSHGWMHSIKTYWCIHSIAMSSSMHNSVMCIWHQYGLSCASGIILTQYGSMLGKHASIYGPMLCIRHHNKYMAQTCASCISIIIIMAIRCGGPVTSLEFL